MSSASRRRFTGLWRSPDFLKLWAGQSVSVFGTLITRVALPVVAVLTLHATPAQVALVYAAQVAPAIVLGLAAGALTDRVRRRPLLIAADVGRALALSTIPLAFAAHAMSLNLLYVVTLVTSALSSLFDVAYPAYLPTLVGRKHALEGNAKMGATSSIAEVGGFGLAGTLVQALTASGAIVIDVITYVVSVITLALIRTPEPAPARAEHSEPRHALTQLRDEVVEGLRLVWSNRTRRALAAVAVAQALGGGLLESVLYIFILRDLKIFPALMSATFGVGGIASFFGAALAERVTLRLGMRRALRVTAWFGAGLTLLMPLAGGPLWLAVALLTATQFGDAGYTLYDIAQMTTLQTISPQRAMGRIMASVRFLGGLATIAGLAIGAAIGQPLGARTTLLVAVLAMLLGPLWLTIERIRPDGESVTQDAPPAESAAPIAASEAS